jgi:hypothetical protein
MARCGVCGRTGLRKTTLATVLEKGQLVGRRAGDCCVGDGVLLIASRVAPVAMATSERKEQSAVLRPFIDNLVARVKSRLVIAPDEDEAEHFEGYTQALEDVVALLKSGRA